MKSVIGLIAVMVCVVPMLYAQTEDSEQKVYKGRIVNSQGYPVEGVTIDIYDFQERSLIPYDTTHAGQVKTDSKGYFSFSRNMAIFDQIACSMAFIQAEGYAKQWVHYHVKDEFYEIILSSRSAAFSGKVVNSEGLPIEGAAVMAFPDLSVAAQGIPALTCRTDAEGRFVFNGFSQDVRSEFYVVKDGYGYMYSFRTDQNWSEPQYAAGRQDITLCLKRLGALTGRLIRVDTGKPLAGEKISLIRNQGKGTRLFTRNALSGQITVGKTLTGTDNYTVTTDSEGKFHLTQLIPGSYSVFHHNYRKGLFTPRGRAIIQEGQLKDIQIEAITGVDVRIKCRLDDGTVAPGKAKVVLKQVESDNKLIHDAFWKDRTEGVCDAEGTGCVNVLPGRYEVSVISNETVLEGNKPIIDVPSAGYPSLTLAVKKPEPEIRDLKGICIDSKSQPVANAKIYLLSDPGNVVQSDKNGHFTLRPRLEECKRNVWWKYQVNKERHDTNPSFTELRLEEQYGEFYQNPDSDWMGIDAYLIAESPDGQFVAIQQFYSFRDVQKGHESLKLELAPACHLKGKAVDGAGQPLPGADVEVLMSTSGFENPDCVYTKTVTDEKGCFVISPVAMKKNYSVVMTTNEGVCLVKEFSAGLERGFSRDVEQFYTQKPDTIDMGIFSMGSKTYKVSGVVTNHLGRPIANARLMLNAPSQGLSYDRFQSGPDGTFEYDGLFAGPVALECHVGKKQHARIDTTAGDENIRFIFSKGVPPEQLGQGLVPSAAVELIFVDEETEEPIILPNAQVVIQPKNNSRFTVNLDDDGKARFLVEPGETSFELSGVSSQYRKLKKTFVAELYQPYSFQYKLAITERYKVVTESGGSLIYPEVLSETGEVWNLQPRKGSSSSPDIQEIFVVDEELGTPVPNAEVLAYFNDGKGRFFGKTNENGKVAFAMFSDVRNCVLTSVSCAGYEESRPDRKLSTIFSDIEKKEIWIKQKPTTINLQVLDLQGNPAPDIWFYHEALLYDRLIKKTKWNSVFDQTRGPTDENGQKAMRWFNEKGPEPQIEHFVYTNYLYKQKGTIAEVIKALPGSEITLQVKQPVQVQGRIVDEQGLGISKLNINFYYLINGFTTSGPNFTTKADGSYGPVYLAPGFEYEIHKSRDRIGLFGESSSIFIGPDEGVIELPDCVLPGK